MDINRGLKDVVALESSISKVDGKIGKLWYRGYNIHDLAKHSSFEEVAYLLWFGQLPTQAELDEFSKDLIQRRNLPNEIVELIKGLPKTTHPMVILRTAISYLGSLDRNLHEINKTENLEKSKDILAKVPTIIAYAYRIGQGKEVIKPDPSKNHAANFLRMLYAKEPTETEIRAMNLDLILRAEHGLNASTFAARIAASTLSDMYAGIVSATGTLMGTLHGGATQEVMKMLRQVKDKNIKEWVKQKLAAKEKIMGIGHRVYQTIDPRARELKALAKQLDSEEGKEWIIILEKIAAEVEEQKHLYPNVDFYVAVVYADLNIPDELFISLFAMSRVAGWCAHLMEQYEDNKLIRPRQKYIGELDKTYLTINKR